MVARLHEIHGETATVITEKNYTVIIPIQMIPEGTKTGDRLLLEFRTEVNQETCFKRIVELENEYIDKYY
ncbi:MAG: hypothetical protein K0R93_954 [Anaerosolibacter sp.]|uniref:hypothetical protein n=1 Tax=Anaerosolibacter sp. TaxID=1872527 RepID=UPI00261C585D|nr:hypothetical protein [Anaerosolibacter sp.]MDF2546056.1 hypothetical protein [Anaerosolibacter sp.]